MTVDPSSIVSDWTQEESTYVVMSSQYVALMISIVGEVLKKVSPEELKAVMESLTSDTLLVYQVRCLYFYNHSFFT